ncbi:unnamed protein product [Zymoseptoria tritici ST99CH_1E4]|uniref:RING-type domain-containing protein n=1 Tax=Zymoseptoria tritici ST99CH_1E4 TaxID=1276532 RepID=A0A2H1GY23_ZYMTR|nr:unnamed protein product [Zymoseptoria tritici ST99CH_1E4]
MYFEIYKDNTLTIPLAFQKMPTAVADPRPPPEIIDLLSSDDEEGDSPERPAPPKRARRDHQPDDDYMGRLRDQDQQAAPGADFHDFHGFDMLGPLDPYDDDQQLALGEPMPAGQFVDVDGEQIFIPDDIPAPPRKAQQERARPAKTPTPDPDASEFTLDFCLSRVLIVLPDVDHEHVAKLHKEANEVTAMNRTTSLKLADVMEKLLSSDYPRQVKEPARKKRRREDEVEEQSKVWEGPGREVAPHQIRGTIASMLKAEFPEISKQQIASEVARHKHFYQTYIALANLKDTGNGGKKFRGRASALDMATADTIATNSGWAPMIDELKAARDRVKEIRRRRVIDEAHRKAEQDNLQRAIDNNETSECQVCFDELPMNRQIHCDGAVAHFTCFDCAELYVKTEVGDARCRVVCTAGCGAPFPRSQLHLLSDKDLLNKLEKLQQEKDIRDAGLEGLEECPFCIDFKIILGPVEEDSELRCGNPECEKVSCRRCKAASHVPLSCEEHAKDNKISFRHRVEEKMSEALIRSCNKCNKKFIKLDGCNKMTCPSCGNLQCYVCSTSITCYSHFNHMPGVAVDPQNPSTKCPLYDNSEERHEREVEAAEAAARAEVMEEQPDITQEDLDIKVSDAVKKSAQDRVRRALPPPGFDGPGPLDMHALLPRIRDDRADMNEIDDLVRMGYNRRRRHPEAFHRHIIRGNGEGAIARRLEALDAARIRQARMRAEWWRAVDEEMPQDIARPLGVRLAEVAGQHNARAHLRRDERLAAHRRLALLGEQQQQDLLHLGGADFARQFNGEQAQEENRIGGHEAPVGADADRLADFPRLLRWYEPPAPLAAVDARAALDENADAAAADRPPIRPRIHYERPPAAPLADGRQHLPNPNIVGAAADFPVEPAFYDGAYDLDLPIYPPLGQHYGRQGGGRLAVHPAEPIIPAAPQALGQQAVDNRGTFDDFPALPRDFGARNHLHRPAADAQPAAEQDFGPDPLELPPLFGGRLPMEWWPPGAARVGNDRAGDGVNVEDDLDRLLENMRRAG